MEAEALLLMLLCYNNYNDKERYLAISDEAGRFYLDNGYMEHYWEYLFLEVNLLHTSNDQEKVIGLIRELYDRAKSMNYAYGLALASCRLGTAYQIAKESDAAMEAFQEAWSHVKQVKDPRKRAKVVYYCGQALVLEYNRNHCYEQSLAILDEWSKNIEACRAWALENHESTFTSDISQIHCDMFRAETYTFTGDFAESDKYLARVAAVVDSYPPLVKNYFLHTQRIIHKERGEYEEALAVSARLKDYYAEKGEVLMYNSSAIDMRESLKSLGRYKEAVALGDEIMALTDSLYSVEHLRQLNELSMIYEVDQTRGPKAATAAYHHFGKRRMPAAGCHHCHLYPLFTQSETENRLALQPDPGDDAGREESGAHARVGPGGRTVPRDETVQGADAADVSRKTVSRPRGRSPLGGGAARHQRKLSGQRHPRRSRQYDFCQLHFGAAARLFARPADRQSRHDARDGGPGIGYASYSPFFRAFVKKYGMSPSEYRRLYSAKTV